MFVYLYTVYSFRLRAAYSGHWDQARRTSVGSESTRSVRNRGRPGGGLRPVTWSLILLKAQSLAPGQSVFARVIYQRVKLYVYTYTYMGSKTISITEDAYHRLRARKRRGESFTDVILRLTERRPLSEFAGVLDEKTGRALADALEEARRERASVDVSR